MNISGKTLEKKKLTLNYYVKIESEKKHVDKERIRITIKCNRLLLTELDA